jgi:EAL domain-containing protein (putative c-di-GMP-specific phosphodiesterase class I)
VEEIDRVLKETALNPESLRLEITENALAAGDDSAKPILNALRSRGFQLYIDDFGAGSFSLDHLCRFPVDALKVDRTFVQGLIARSEDREVVRAILSLAHGLGIEVVAEGVETQEQAEALLELGSDYGQGLLFGGPLSPAEARERIAGSAESPPAPTSGRNLDPA